MENKKAIFISVICVMISLFLISGYISVRRSELTADFGKEVTVVVAAKPIPEFGIIHEDMLKVITVFKNFRQPQTVDRISDLVGKAAYVSIYQGEQITLTKLIHKDGKPVLDHQVEKRMRAVTLAISPVTGVGKLIRPGNRVDIIISPNYDSGGATVFEIKTLMQNVLVLATGKNIQNSVPTHVDRDVLGVIEEQLQAQKRKDIGTGSSEGLSTARPDDNYTSITLQLSPEDAEKILFLAHTFGDQRLYFTLRNNADQQVAKLDTTLLDQVLGPNSDYGRVMRRPPPLPPPTPPKYYDNVGGRQVPVR